MKDFYWDIRPKPEYGTIEIRVCRHAAHRRPRRADRGLRAGARAAASAPSASTGSRPTCISSHSHNRFQACRHGLAGTIVDHATRRSVPLAEDIRNTLRELAPHAAALESAGALERLTTLTLADGNDATWLRKVYAETETLPDVVRRQAARWMGEP